MVQAPGRAFFTAGPGPREMAFGTRASVRIPAIAVRISSGVKTRQGDGFPIPGAVLRELPDVPRYLNACTVLRVGRWGGHHIGVDVKRRYWPGLAFCASAVAVAALCRSEAASVLVVTAFVPAALMALLLPTLAWPRNR